MSVERAWELMARKLAGEASEAELKELDQLLKANPSLHFPLQTIAGLWQQKPGSDQMELDARFSKTSPEDETAGHQFCCEQQRRRRARYIPNV